MKKITFLFIISFCLGQNTYVGSVSFDYSGSINGSFQAELSDSTLGGATAAVINGDPTSSLFMSAIQSIDSTTVSVLLIYIQDNNPIFSPGNWSLPPDDILNPDIVFGFIPEIDTSFFNQLVALIPDSIEQDSTLLDSTFLEDLITEILLIISDDTYLGLSGSINLAHISADSINGSFDIGALRAGFPPGIINISNGMIDLDGIILPEVGVENESVIPDQIILYKPYPNPFNPITTIRFSLEMQYATSLRIFNITGRLMDELINGELAAGEHEVVWKASNLPSGVYFIQLISGNNIQTEKVLLIK